MFQTGNQKDAPKSGYGFLLPLILLVSLSYSWPVGGLPIVPDSVKIDGNFIKTGPSGYSSLLVEEFVDRTDGSIKVRVSDLTKYESRNTWMSYYRIKEFSSISGQLDFYSIVALDESDLKCSKSSTLEWELEPLTQILQILGTSETMRWTLTQDRTSIGLTGLLRVVHEHSHLFVMQEKIFDPINLLDMYYFSTDMKMDDESIVKIICSIPFQSINNKKSLEFGKTTLSELDSRSFIGKVHVIYLNGETKKLMNSDISSLILNDNLNKVVISYQIVQQMTIVSQSGGDLGNTDKKNPFQLQRTAGCGLVSLHNPIHINSQRFSGRYIAIDSPGEKYIAFDSDSSHLRLDIVGSHKIIYDLSNKKATFIPYEFKKDMATNLIDSNLTEMEHKFSDSYHCSKLKLDQEKDSDCGLNNANSMVDIMGFSSDIGLMFLGTQILEDGFRTLVFEREISIDQIPVIALANLRLSYHHGERFFLTYYFADELHYSIDRAADTGSWRFESKSYEYMWLKRFEFTTRHKSLVKSGFLNSRVTFIESSWFLDSLAEDTRDRNSMVAYPVRVFDTEECKGENEEFQLRLMLQEKPTSTWFNSLSSVNEKSSDYYQESRDSIMTRSIRLLEESSINFLSTRLGVPRSRINKLELISYEPKDVETNRTEIQENSIIIRSQLTPPLKFTIDRHLIGWVKDMGSVLFNKTAVMIDTRPMISRHECSLNLASRSDLSSKIHTLYCVNGGCGYISDISKVDFLKVGQESEPPKTNNHFYFCEIYLQSQNLDYGSESVPLLDDKYLDMNLKNKQLIVGLDASSIDDIEFRADVTGVFLEKHRHIENLSKKSKDGFCYSKNMEKLHIGNTSIEIDTLQVELDPHQSLIQCSKACQLRLNCLSFSYHKLKRICTLTNVDISTYSIVDLIRVLEGDSSCAIYALNPVHLYKEMGEVQMTTPSRLSFTDYHLTKSSLADCAKLCRKYELVDIPKEMPRGDSKSTSDTFACREFKYLHVNSICAIKDAEHYLLNVIDKIFDGSGRKYYNQQRIGSDRWYGAQAFNTYLKNPLHFYSSVESTGLLIQEPQPDDISDSSTSARLPILYDLSQEDCLYECTALNEDCVALDYSRGSRIGDKKMSDRSCIMYRIRSPFSLNLKNSQKLNYDRNLTSSMTDLEKLFYLEGESSRHGVSSVSKSCIHSYLDIDYLSIKRKLLHHESSSPIDKIKQKYREVSEAYLSQMAIQLRLNPDIGVISALTQLIIGSIIGCLVFMYKPELSIDFSSGLSNLNNRARNIWFNLRNSGRNRSMSTIDLNELDDL